MDDITGVGKVADSKLVKSVYDDSVSPAAKELGKMGEDVAKTLRLFTAPFQLAAVAQDRFEMWLSEVRQRVPAERQIEAPPHIAGPALRAMLFMDEGNPLAVYFLNLLSQAIDKDKADGVHPAFVNVLEQICPEEAVLLKHYYQCYPMMIGHNHITHLEGTQDVKMWQEVKSYPLDISDVASAANVTVYIEHLCTLGLLAKDETTGVIGENKEDMRKKYSFWYKVTEFGRVFCTVCIQPENPTNTD